MMTDPVSDTSVDPLDDFAALSAILTGIAADKLHPPLDTHGTAAEYLAYATQHGGAVFTQLMTVYAANRTQPPATIAELILTRSGQDVALMARVVMLMWYLGSWYPPETLAIYQAKPGRFLPPGIVISSDAYTQGWAWRVGQAHPMGYSDLRFGYWHGAPQALSDLVGA